MSAGEVGVIGLGLLGGAVAARLVERGTSVIGSDRDAERRRVAAEAGVVVVDDVGDVVRRRERILLSLPDGDAVTGLLEQLRPQLRRGHTIIDTTTAAPEQMIAHAARLGDCGVAYVEAEIAGSSAQARRGEVLVFAAGEASQAEACRTLLESFAAEVHYVGPHGAAAKLKLVHNLILGLHRAVLAEGLAFAEALQLDAARTLDLLKRTPAASAVMTTKGPKMAARNFAPQATVRQHLKDVRLILAAAAKAGAVTPLSAAHAELLERAIALGHAESDNTAVIAVFDRRSRSQS